MIEGNFIGSTTHTVNLTRTVVNAVMDLVILALRPLALLTQAFVRRDFGERYFTPLAGLIGVLVVLAVTLSEMQRYEPLSIDLMAKLTSSDRINYPFVFKNVHLWSGAFWMIGLAAAYWINWFSIRRRYRNGMKWHSRCGGVSLIPKVELFGQTVICLLVAVAFELATCSRLAMLVLASAGASIIIERSTRKALFERVLDVMDAELEAEVLGKAIKHRLAPKQANGITTAIPAFMGEKTIDRIAEAFGYKEGRPEQPAETTAVTIEAKPSGNSLARGTTEATASSIP